ncbi:hypothetical protein RJ639_021217 [Escallonia herrerae]|uniref:EF-hand domain-containing protein n=1 Tax=Escallonia herrerae TaxID=1293975 RepID=A0AA88V515_9ASTE|nr:hypothetical protein RJ639_021217 [Escallonia herrerae]
MAIFNHGKVCSISLTDNVVDMIFYVFDENRDGNLSSDEFLKSFTKTRRGHFAAKGCRLCPLSMVASADMKNINKFLDRVDEITNELGLTFEEFNNFAELRKRLLPLSMALFSHGKVDGQLTKQDFQRAAYHVCGIPLTDNVVDMIFYGNLSSDEFLRVLQRREGDILQPNEAGYYNNFDQHCYLVT